MTCKENAADMAGTVQAWAAVVAIVAGFAYIGLQRWLESVWAGRATGRLARHSLDLVSERLAALIDPSKPTEFGLRGARATEAIEVFREFGVSHLPAKMIESVAIIRSAVHAINCRIDDVLRDDEGRRMERRSRLHSAGRILTTARNEFEKTRIPFKRWGSSSFELQPLKEDMVGFITEANAADR